MSSKMEAINISKHLFKLLEQKIKQNNFQSVDDYVEHILMQVLQSESTDDLDPEEEEEIKKRLERLGYL
ncbi:MAG: hypothetical protein ACFFB2_06380 [Promethearchaeota archaeon]